MLKRTILTVSAVASLFTASLAEASPSFPFGMLGGAFGFGSHSHTPFMPGGSAGNPSLGGHGFGYGYPGEGVYTDHNGVIGDRGFGPYGRAQRQFFQRYN